MVEALRRVDGGELEAVERNEDDWHDNGGARVLISSDEIDNLSPDGVDVGVIRLVGAERELAIDEESFDYLALLLVDMERVDESIDVIAAWLKRYV